MKRYIQYWTMYEEYKFRLSVYSVHLYVIESSATDSDIETFVCMVSFSVCLYMCGCGWFGRFFVFCCCCLQNIVNLIMNWCTADWPDILKKKLYHRLKCNSIILNEGTISYVICSNECCTSSGAHIDLIDTTIWHGRICDKGKTTTTISL